jgi:hypothetical protein
MSRAIGRDPATGSLPGALTFESLHDEQILTRDVLVEVDEVLTLSLIPSPVPAGGTPI